MDLGIFARNRVRMMAWIIIPFLSTVVIYYSLRVYCRSVTEAAERRRAFMHLLPDLNWRLGTARDVVMKFSPPAAKEPESIDRSLNNMAQRNGFVINSLRIEKGGKDPAARKDKVGAPFLAVTVQGEGNLLALLKFLNEVQGPYTIVDARGVGVQARKVLPQPYYEAELLLYQYCMKE